MFEKEKYETPKVEIIEFELTDSIAESLTSGSGTFGFDEIWGQ